LNNKPDNSDATNGNGRLVLKSKSPTRYYNNLSTENLLPEEACEKVAAEGQNNN